ncbi:probable LRR receptor-like serine/threonine-protein kinase At3g47570 isoform X2 [Durio zibethinus]|uniref:non-specific serine/threonine protein kinase n=1 Tax=Durio zibethinus TaxID=66656 RepID=A0A6P6B5L9_DURZI|nr:probable LRR receptor-like serine/threonine-protein kinase At3g47570 isoform X2 [Durio zibethinus]
MNSSGLSLLMRLSEMHFKAPCSSKISIHVAVFLLLCFNLKGPFFLGSAALAINANETDRQALLQFKAKIAGDQLGIMRSWNNSVHFCQWRGVKCGRRHQRVTRLDLPALKLMGPISPYIGNLSFLRVLSLQNNSFIQELPQEIGRLHRLEEITLDRNFIVGEIPSNISGCSKLKHLCIRHNLLVGEIPAALGHLSNLKELGLTNNTLRGSIPPFIGNLSSLEIISLAINRLSGVIPETLGQLKNLITFGVAINKMSGIVPSSLFNLSNIRILDIGENNFHGSLPSQLGVNMPYLEKFYVSLNQLSGPFPLSISNASNLIELQVDGNKFSGKISSFRELEKLQRLNIGANLLGSHGANDLNFLCSLTSATGLELVVINDNSFGGILPECISNLSTALTIFLMEGNNIVGRIPSGFGNLINLEVLSAGQNQLSGSIPSVIGRLQKLRLFYVNNNSISGSIPTSLGNLKMLIKLHLNDNNLQGEIPPSLGKCENLILLDLSNNNLSGSIPSQIAGLSSLSIGLYLSSNRLTGVLPFEVGNLRNLGELDVSQNMLSGVIPNDLGNCIMLEVLLMRGNFFNGSIPSSLSSLRGLTNLDLSRNNLTGKIPEFLVTFGALIYLNLSCNNFEGLVPLDGVFKNASAAFLEGNSKLCGGTPEFHLPTCDNLKQHRGRSTISLKSIIAIVSALSGVILVFFLMFLFWFRKKRKQPASPNAENPLLRLSYQSILKATNGFSSENLVGTGSFGFVYKGILEENGTIIAVKVLKLLSHGASKSFLAECEALRNVRHRNLVKVLTACSGVDYQGNDFKALVYEFIANGSLEDWLHPTVGMNEGEETAKSLNFFQRLNVAVDVGCALEYLHHHCEAPIVHCDLKPSNILLDDEMVGHIGDFGLAKFITSDIQNNTSSLSSSLWLRGTIGYVPPEYGLGCNVTTYGDVYSYGILLLEMFTGRRPTDEMFKENQNLHNFVKTALPNRVAEITDPTLLQQSFGGETVMNNTFNESSQKHNRLLRSLNSIFEIGIACSFELPTERMNMVNVVAELCSVRDKLLPTQSLRTRAAGTA